MKIIIVGAGVVGLATAKALQRLGADVTLFDRREGPGLETSFANGGFLSASMAQPWNAPGSWRMLLRSLGDEEAPLQFRLRAVPSLAGWGVRFLRQSSSACYLRNTASNVGLAAYSVELMREQPGRPQSAFSASARGTLKIFRDGAAMRAAFDDADRLAGLGVAHRLLTRDELIELEPGLRPVAGELAGAIHYPDDMAGDAHAFCTELAGELAQSNVQLRFGEAVDRLSAIGGRVRGVEAGGKLHSADHVVLATASFTNRLLASLGTAVPVQPVKGYSLSVPIAGPPPLAIPILDDALHCVVTPLPGQIRVAGVAEFAGHDERITESRIASLRRSLGKVLPDLADAAASRGWCGFRATSSDGVPLVGRARDGLWLNTGHGHLGWTMAVGSAQMLADLIAGRPPAIDPRPYRPERFA